jgi:DNA-binding response OmpR family regulator
MSEDAVKDVLIVDDDDAVRNMMYSALTRAGLKCDMASDGVDAVERLVASTYAVVLLDLMMPKLDGPGVLKEFRSRKLPQADRPIVVMVTASTDHEPLHAVAEMAQVVIRKPFDLHELTALVHDCVAARAAN